MKTSILAIYAPKNPADGTICRHIADVIDNGYRPPATGRTYDETDDFVAKARATMPAGAAHLTAMMALPSGQPGYAATMAKVNTGTPGYPA